MSGIMNFIRSMYVPEQTKLMEKLNVVDPLLDFESTTRNLGHYTPYRSNNIYSYDFRTQILLLVTPEQIPSTGPKGERIFVKKIVFKPGLLYVEALNIKFAQKRVEKGKFIIPTKTK